MGGELVTSLPDPLQQRGETVGCSGVAPQKPSAPPPAMVGPKLEQVLSLIFCYGRADVPLRRHSSATRRSAVVIVLAIGKPSPRPCLESSQSPSGVPAARSTRTMVQ